MATKQSYPEASEHAEAKVDTTRIAEDAADNASTVEEAKRKAEREVNVDVKKALDETPPHIINDVQDDLAWEAKRKAKTQYQKENVGEFI